MDFIRIAGPEGIGRCQQGHQTIVPSPVSLPAAIVSAGVEQHARKQNGDDHRWQKIQSMTVHFFQSPVSLKVC